MSEQLGIPVDYTVCVDLKGFAALVDAIGGVDFDVPINMDYDDPYPGPVASTFHKGHAASQRQPTPCGWCDSAIITTAAATAARTSGRMATQQKFLKAVAKKMLSAADILTWGKSTSYAKIFQTSMWTPILTVRKPCLAGHGGYLKMGVDKIEFLHPARCME